MTDDVVSNELRHSRSGEEELTVERTLVMIKPDGVQRGLVGELVGRFERRGLHLVGLKLMSVSRELAERHYGEHRDRPFFAAVIDFITSSPIVAMVWEGPNAVSMVRSMMGPTNPATAASGTIRGDFGIDIGQNVIHGSDSPARAEQEIALFFAEAELVTWEREGGRWIYP
ncbi:MAG TPA: nucleoside-diphosphate kinase [Candidatus Micrarchaeaceae archaeon]|nr:nucleoside-diphosphate kinase [Candidatus Micrarchaeaceae archaeon]